jgi:predicted nucleic acid-binding protein
MILVDTSVWIDYLRSSDAELAQRLQQDQVLMHPMVLGELALGNLQDRQLLLGLWQALSSIPIATDAQVLAAIEFQNLMGTGIGWIDAHLLTAVLFASDVQLWTRDKRLRNLAETLNLAAPLP